MTAARHHRHRDQLGEGAQRGGRGVGAGVGHGLLLVGEEGVAQRELVEEAAGPLLGGVPADVRVDAGAVRGRLGDPLAGLGLEVHQGGARLGRVAHQRVLRVRRLLAVGDQGAVAAVCEGDGDRGGPAVRGAGEREVDALLVAQDAPAVLAVEVVAEDRGQRGAQTEPGRGHREVRDPAGAAAHAGRPDLLARCRRLREPREDEVVEEQPGQQHIGPVVVHTPPSRQKSSISMTGIVRRSPRLVNSRAEVSMDLIEDEE